MEPITVRYRWQASELKRLTRFRLRWVYRLQGLAGAVMVVTVAAIILVEGWPDAASLVIPVAAVALLYVLVAGLLFNVAAAPARRRLLDRLVADDVQVTVEDDGVRVEQGATTVFQRWPAFTGLAESPEFLILEQGRRALVSLPRRAFADETAVRALVNAVREHLGTPI